MARLIIGFATIIAIAVVGIFTKDTEATIFIGLAGFVLMVFNSIGTTDNDHAHPIPQNTSIVSKRRHVGGWYRTTFLYLVDSSGRQYQVNQKTFNQYPNLPIYEDED